MTDTEHRETVIEKLDLLPEMKVDAARGIQMETSLNRRVFETTNEGKPDFVYVLLAGSGIIVIMDNYVSEHFAWSGDLDDQKLLGDLVADGFLIER